MRVVAFGGLSGSSEGLHLDLKVSRLQRSSTAQHNETLYCRGCTAWSASGRGPVLVFHVLGRFKSATRTANAHNVITVAPRSPRLWLAESFSSGASCLAGKKRTLSLFLYSLGLPFDGQHELAYDRSC